MNAEQIEAQAQEEAIAFVERIRAGLPHAAYDDRQRKMILELALCSYKLGFQMGCAKTLSALAAAGS